MEKNLKKSSSILGIKKLNVLEQNAVRGGGASVHHHDHDHDHDHLQDVRHAVRHCHCHHHYHCHDDLQDDPWIINVL